MDTTPRTISLDSSRWFQRLDITSHVEKLVRESGIKNGQISISSQSENTGIEASKNNPLIIGFFDMLHFWQALLTRGTHSHGTVIEYKSCYLHSDIVGRSENIPIIDGKLNLAKGKSIFLLEFNGPRKEIQVVCVFSEKF